MQVILLERIGRLGQMGDVVTVKNGFARNFLLPQKKALRATPENLARFEKDRGQLEARNLELKKEAEAVAGTSLTGGLLFAYLLAGLALLHCVARGRSPWILWLVYASLIVLGPYAAFLITAGGLLDAPLKLRRRLSAKVPSP